MGYESKRISYGRKCRECTLPSNLRDLHLRDKQLLLLLDNFEQVMDLLAACPKLKVVVTSRAVLHVRGEQEFALPPLAVPDPSHMPDLVAWSQHEAVALFLVRALLRSSWPSPTTRAFLGLDPTRDEAASSR